MLKSKSKGRGGGIASAGVGRMQDGRASHRQVSKNKCGGCMHGDKAVAGAKREERERERYM